jgi:4-amino-4-deoxy-L-arabinose transferase-like glycosyltransferase/Flp pilus assembly protein TadD
LKDTPIVQHPIADSRTYITAAQKILNGDWSGTTTFTNPFYYYFAGIVELIFGFLASPKFISILVIQSLLSTATVLLIYKMAKQLFDEKVAFTSAVVILLYEVLIFFDNTVLSVSLINFLNTLMLYFLFQYYDNQKTRYLFFSGLVCGLSIITRANLYLFLPFGIIWLWMLSGKNFKETSRRTGYFVLGMLVFIIAITVRNYLVTSELIPISSNFGYNFYVGNNEKSNGTYVKPEFVHSTAQYYEEKESEEEAARRTGKNLSPNQASWFWMGEGLNFIKNDPARYISLLGEKTYLFFNNVETANNLSNYTARDFSSLLKYLPSNFGIISGLGILGIILIIFNNKDSRLYLLVFLIGTYFLANIIIMVASEYRAPVIMYFIVFAVFAVFKLYDSIKTRKYAILLSIIPLVGFIYWTNYHNKNLDNYRSTEADYIAFANDDLKYKDYKSALVIYKMAVQSDTTKKYLFFKIARMYQLLNDNKNALIYYKMTPKLEQYPDSVKLGYWVLQANEYYSIGDYDNAETMLRKVIQLDTIDYSSMNNLATCYMKIDSLDQAEQILLKSINVNPNYTFSYANLGEVYFKKKNYNASVSYLLKAHSMDTLNPYVKLDLIRSYLKLQNKNKTNEIVYDLKEHYQESSPIIQEMNKIISNIK